MTTFQSPFSTPFPDDVQLTNSPLVRVIAQVRFPTILSVERNDFIADFQEAIREKFPILRPDKSIRLHFTTEDASRQTETTLWRFVSSDGKWGTTLSSEFLSFETNAYTNRPDFTVRFAEVLNALVAHVRPDTLDRLGVRFCNHLSGENLREVLGGMVRPEFAGSLVHSTIPELLQSATVQVFNLPDELGQLALRSGLTPPKGNPDPSIYPKSDHYSWNLDLDAYATALGDFDVPKAVHRTEALAREIYRLFRWVMTEEFLRDQGGAS